MLKLTKKVTINYWQLVRHGELKVSKETMLDKLKQMNDMRKQAKALQDILAQEEITGTSRNNYVKIVMDGNQNIKSVSVSEEILNNRILIEDSIKQVIESLNDKLRQVMMSKMGGMGGLGDFLK